MLYEPIDTQEKNSAAQQLQAQMDSARYAVTKTAEDAVRVIASKLATNKNVFSSVNVSFVEDTDPKNALLFKKALKELSIYAQFSNGAAFVLKITPFVYKNFASTEVSMRFLKTAGLDLLVIGTGLSAARDACKNAKLESNAYAAELFYQVQMHLADSAEFLSWLIEEQICAEFLDYEARVCVCVRANDGLVSRDDCFYTFCQYRADLEGSNLNVSLTAPDGSLLRAYAIDAIELTYPRRIQVNHLNAWSQPVTPGPDIPRALVQYRSEVDDVLDSLKKSLQGIKDYFSAYFNP